jgi:hypothetical protein
VLAGRVARSDTSGGGLVGWENNHGQPGWSEPARCGRLAQTGDATKVSQIVVVHLYNIPFLYHLSLFPTYPFTFLQHSCRIGEE